jgi:hypothetical protein
LNTFSKLFQLEGFLQTGAVFNEVIGLIGERVQEENRHVREIRPEFIAQLRSVLTFYVGIAYTEVKFTGTGCTNGFVLILTLDDFGIALTKVIAQ